MGGLMKEGDRHKNRYSPPKDIGEALLGYVNINRGVTPADAAKKLGLTTTSAGHYMARLGRRGKIMRVGRKNPVYYPLKVI